MGGSMYCRTCTAAPGEAAEVMIDIFANAKVIALLSTLKEWQLDIMQDDDLSQCICEKCELALIQIDKFRVQALRAKEYLQSQLHLLNTNTGDADAISDNENDLHAKSNCGGANIMKAIPNALPTVLSKRKAMHADHQISNVTNANEKTREAEQLNELESGLIAVNEETGELSFDSNIESSRPPEFQVVLIEEEEETKLQWINEDDNAGEKCVQEPNNRSSYCQRNSLQIETELYTLGNSSASSLPHSIELSSNINEGTEKGEKESKEINFGLQKSLRRNNAYNYEENCEQEKCNINTRNCENHLDVSEFVTFDELKTDDQFSRNLTESLNEFSASSSSFIEISVKQQGQINDLQTLLVAIKEQVASFESSKVSNDFSTEDLQSVLMNELTLQMINANVNILEEDLQIDEFESLLAAVDEQASTLGSVRSSKHVAELSERHILHNMGFDKETELDSLDNRRNLMKAAGTCFNENDTKNIVSYHSSDETIQSSVKRKSCSDDFIANHPNSKNIVKIFATGYKHNDIEYSLCETKEPLRATPTFPRSKNKAPRNIRCRLCVCNVSEQPVFDTEQLLEDHIASIHDDKERPYNCPQCAARYRTRSGCVAHINAIHLKKGDSCELCGKVVAGGSGQMRMHKERNHTHGNYTCEICHLELKNVSLYNFKYHKRWHNEDKLWRCELCEKAFVKRTHLMAHKVTHTRQGEFLCTRCGKSTRSKWELRAHLYAIHGEGEAPLKCNFCEEKFTQHIQKRGHLERCHPIELARSTMPCPKCEKQFSTEPNLQRHIKKQHQLENVDRGVSELSASSAQQYEGFMCAHCPRKYRSKYALIKHLGVHVAKKDRPYSCRDCDMHFKHFSELDRHDLHHHATVRPYRCEECPKAFSTRTALKIHGQVHEVKGKKLRCPECNQRFKFEKSLKLHCASHKKMRHSCDICSKSYIRLAQLKTHKNRYHKITSESEEE